MSLFTGRVKNSVPLHRSLSPSDRLRKDQEETLFVVAVNRQKNQTSAVFNLTKEDFENAKDVIKNCRKASLNRWCLYTKKNDYENHFTTYPLPDHTNSDIYLDHDIVAIGIMSRCIDKQNRIKIF